MKKIHVFSVLALGGALLVMPVSVQAAEVTFVAANKTASILQAELATRQAIANATLSTKQNLTVKATRLLKSELDADDEKQRITFFVGNNKHGGKKLSELFFPYEVELYEVVGKKRVKQGDVFKGYALIPSADINSSFRIELPSEGYREAENRTFVAKIRIDSDRWIKESNEKDNVKWTKEWTLLGND